MFYWSRWGGLPDWVCGLITLACLMIWPTHQLLFLYCVAIAWLSCRSCRVIAKMNHYLFKTSDGDGWRDEEKHWGADWPWWHSLITIRTHIFVSGDDDSLLWHVMTSVEWSFFFLESQVDSVSMGPSTEQWGGIQMVWDAIKVEVRKSLNWYCWTRAGGWGRFTKTFFRILWRHIYVFLRTFLEPTRSDFFQTIFDSKIFRSVHFCRSSIILQQTYDHKSYCK